MIDMQCTLCGDECESVGHVLWECAVYDSIRNTFWDNLMGGFEECSTLDNFYRVDFILVSENLDRYDFKALLKQIKSFVFKIGILW